MKILVTGIDGYIGTVLGPYLLDQGHDVVGLDTGFYRAGWLYSGVKHFPKVITKDIRNVTVEDLKGFDVVVHMAELSNDPLGQLNRELTFAVNHKGSVALAEKAKAAGVPRFIYTSSCSAYGIGTEEVVSEKSKVNPQTAYAECKVLVEHDVAAMADDNFSPVFLRNATAYGASPRQRFDLVVNNLAGLAWTLKEIRMTSDGTPWRPLVHILDIAQAIHCAAIAPREAVHAQIFNVGNNEGNHRVKEVAEIIHEVFPECSLSFGSGDKDNRSYKVNFDKINTQLPGFKCKWSVRKGAEQLKRVFEGIAMDNEVFTFRGYTRIKQLEYLINTKQVNGELFWKEL